MELFTPTTSSITHNVTPMTDLLSDSMQCKEKPVEMLAERKSYALKHPLVCRLVVLTAVV